MIQFKEITSPSNRLIKEARSLSIKKYRLQTGKFIADGVKPVLEALKSGFILNCFLNTDRIHKLEEIKDLKQLLKKLPEGRLIGVPDRIFRSLAPTENPQGIAAVCSIPSFDTVAAQIDNFSFHSACLPVLEDVSDPGNCGTIIRTAAAIGCLELVFAGGADPFGPKSVRASAGTIFRTNIKQVRELPPLLFRLRNLGYQIIVADSKGKISLPNHRFAAKTAIILGSEAQGATRKIRDAADSILSIPVSKGIDSLNVAAAAAILFYAFKHQQSESISNK